MPTSQITTLDRLKEALATLDQQYHGTYRTPEAIYALMKTIKTFNITITDWNTLIDYVNVVGLTLDALYAVVPEIVDAIDSMQNVDLFNDQEIDGAKTFIGTVKVPAPTEDSDAATKKYVDDNDATKVNKLTTSGVHVYVHTGSTQGEVGLDISAQENKIPLRDSNGHLYVPQTPTNQSHAASKEYVDRSVTSVYKYKGSVSTATNLPTSNLTVGDVYDVQEDGQNYAWNGTSWDTLGVNSYTKAQTDERFLSAFFLAADEYDPETGTVVLRYTNDMYTVNYNDTTGVLTVIVN